MPEVFVQILAAMFLSLAPGCLLARALLPKHRALHWTLLLPLGITLTVLLNGLLWLIASAVSLKISGLQITLLYAAVTLASLAFHVCRVPSAQQRLQCLIAPVPGTTIVLLVLGLMGSAFVWSLFPRRSVGGYTSIYVPFPEQVLQHGTSVPLTLVPIVIETHEAAVIEYHVEIRNRERVFFTKSFGNIEPGTLIELTICFEPALESLERWEVVLLRAAEEVPYRTLILWLPAAGVETHCTNRLPLRGDEASGGVHLDVSDQPG